MNSSFLIASSFQFSDGIVGMTFARGSVLTVFDDNGAQGIRRPTLSPAQASEMGRICKVLAVQHDAAWCLRSNPICLHHCWGCLRK